MILRRLSISCLTVGAILIAGQFSLVSAQVKGNVLTGSALSESAVVSALLPRPPGVKTRGIALRKDDAPGSASLLITFKVNSAELSPSAREELDIVAGALNSNELSRFGFDVEGHADPRGDAQFNDYLSHARADSVVQYLVSVHGVARNRLSPVGKGNRELMRPDQPSAPENRRVTIKTQVR